ncbi:uncharacterized protein LOC115450686 isoform X2 [Manduca sexta]|uniref:uncharacterized protein LOC115450686 isoform X2 n=1 Tax=Manduca sexta TaxID=7130 RepID=UPI00188ED7F1|nr:uncharacterized protein LOC115450686 isoform X2 [Manduca sexta]
MTQLGNQGPGWKKIGLAAQHQSRRGLHCSEGPGRSQKKKQTVNRFLILKKAYKHMFSKNRLERIDHMIEAANATCYSKLANCVIDLKKQDTKEVKKKKGWSESEWKKHMDYISQIAGPKRDFKPPPLRRGKSKPLDELLPRINQICFFPEFKLYKRLSQDTGYRNPVKVAPKALTYVISDRVKKLATPRAIPQPDSF